jgi:hypothetical protein
MCSKRTARYAQKSVSFADRCRMRDGACLTSDQRGGLICGLIFTEPTREVNAIVQPLKGHRMGLVQDIIAIRICGAVRCGLSSRPSPTVPELAREFGLREEVECNKDIDEPDARRLVQMLLHRDVAYNAEVMPEARVTVLADAFLAQFGPGTRYFYNGSWHMPPVTRPDGVVSGASWNPVTPATFDTGVLAIGLERSGCLWIEDED